MTQNVENTQNARPSNPPKFIAYAVSEEGRGRRIWTRLGVIREHKRGEGMTAYIDVLPVGFNGRIVMLPPKPEDSAAQAEAVSDEIVEGGA